MIIIIINNSATLETIKLKALYTEKYDNPFI